MSDQEAEAAWTNGDGGGKEKEGLQGVLMDSNDGGSQTTRKRTRSSDSDSSQSAEGTEASQKKIKIVVRRSSGLTLLS